MLGAAARCRFSALKSSARRCSMSGTDSSIGESSLLNALNAPVQLSSVQRSMVDIASGASVMSPPSSSRSSAWSAVRRWKTSMLAAATRCANVRKMKRLPSLSLFRSTSLRLRSLPSPEARAEGMTGEAAWTVGYRSATSQCASSRALVSASCRFSIGNLRVSGTSRTSPFLPQGSLTARLTHGHFTVERDT